MSWSKDNDAPHCLALRDGVSGTDLLLLGARFTRRFEQAGSYD